MNKCHRVVIVGGGFAGLNAAKQLKKAPLEVTVIDRRNHHLFQPLLYQVATGGLSPADIAAPIRALLKGQANARVILGEVELVDLRGRFVVLVDGGRVPYDTLVIASGSRHSYFGNDHWGPAAPGLKTLEDAIEVRRRVLFVFEAAERATGADERRALLTFVVVGGGPTGVEMAGAIGEMARNTLKGNFRSFDSRDARVMLLEGGERVLPTFTVKLACKASAALSRLGVEVRTRALVENADAELVRIATNNGPELIPARTIVWAAGVQASPLGKTLAVASGAETDRPGRLLVGPDLTVPGHPEIFVAGDLASYSHHTGTPLRGTADVAIAEGRYVGKTIRRRLAGKRTTPFRFRDLGTLPMTASPAVSPGVPGCSSTL